MQKAISNKGQTSDEQQHRLIENTPIFWGVWGRSTSILSEKTHHPHRLNRQSEKRWTEYSKTLLARIHIHQIDRWTAVKMTKPRHKVRMGRPLARLSGHRSRIPQSCIRGLHWLKPAPEPVLITHTGPQFVFITTVVFQNQWLEQIEIGRAGKGVWRSAILCQCPWSVGPHPHLQWSGRFKGKERRTLHWPIRGQLITLLPLPWSYTSLTPPEEKSPRLDPI